MDLPARRAFSGNAQANSLLVIIRDFNRVSVMPSPLETDPKLIVDSNAVLSLPAAVELLQAVSGWDLEIIEYMRAVEQRQFPLGHVGGWRAPRFAGAPDFRRPLVGESLDHGTSITLSVNNVNRY